MRAAFDRELNVQIDRWCPALIMDRRIGKTIGLPDQIFIRYNGVSHVLLVSWILRVREKVILWCVNDLNGIGRIVATKME
jgi:hypothetical protein